MEAIILVVVLIFSVVVHEVAHAWQARREGDDTADQMGRITLNPLPHIDPIGSIILPGILAWQGGIIFGWAKPVPVNPLNYRDYVAGDIRVSMAGIIANLILAALATLTAGILVKVTSIVGPLGGVSDLLFLTLNYTIFINLILANFNLIPIPPLDGSHVLAHALPDQLADHYQRLSRFGLFILMFLVFLPIGRPLFELLLWPTFFLQGLADQFIRLWI
jgi:Zn-dependent protease|tara:strand:- start:469 stop:1125 length:657 start_codon:yes stop_codon:yes gene_type:complete